MTLNGPEAQARAARLSKVDELVRRLQALYPGQIAAIGLYGSLAREQDGPYSDIEMCCVLHTPEVETDYGWIYGLGKAEINVYGPDVARAQAEQVSARWPLSCGQFLRMRPLYGDPAVFEALRERVLAVPTERLRQEAHAMVVGELYEWMGKLRNAMAAQQYAQVPTLACRFAEWVALILALLRHTGYTSGGTVLPESLRLPDLPEGYAALCQRVMEGRLSPPDAVSAALEAVWSGLGPWLAGQGLDFEPRPWPAPGGGQGA